jgi:hypothetical protein
MNRRVVRGFVVAAIIPIVVACVMAHVFVALEPGDFGAAIGFAIVITTLVSAPVSIVATLLIGVPAHWIATRLGRRSLRFYIAGGAAISLLVTALLALDFYRGAPGNEAQMMFNNLTLVASLLSGPLASFVFWKIARPDQVSAPAPDP